MIKVTYACNYNFVTDTEETAVTAALQIVPCGIKGHKGLQQQLFVGEPLQSALCFTA